MTMQFSMLLKADADQARGGIKSLAGDQEKLRQGVAALRAELARNQAEMAKLAAQGQRGGAAYKALSADAARLRAELAGVNGSIAVNATQLRQVQAGGQLAAGSLGNLAAQFNDIGLMMAAGQNPLQLALQQGTQIGQVIGPMGAGGAVRALGSAFLSVLSPVNLLTIGIIGFGAAAVQWLTRAEENAASFDDALSGLGDSLKAVRESGSTTFEDLEKEFGAVTAEVIEMQSRLQKLRLRDLLLDAAEAAKSFGTEIDAMDGLLTSGVGRLGELFDLSIGGASQMAQAWENVGRADGLSAQITALGRVQALIIEAAGGIEEMTTGQAALYTKTLDLERALRAAAAASGDIPDGISAAASAADGLSANLAVSVGLMRELAAIQRRSPTENLLWARVQSGLVPGVALPGGGQPGAPTGSTISPVSLPDLPRTSAAARGAGGAEAAQKEADAVQNLIDKLQGEIDLLRESDPIQKELLRNRETLKDATEAERAKVEELIAVREREAQAAANLKAGIDFFNTTAASAIDALIVKGESLDDVLRNIIASLAKAAIQAALFGSGPFGGLFGGTSLGSLIFGGAKADGGRIDGPGTDTSDNIAILASPGEYIVKAKSARRNMALLEAINADRALPRFSSGGMVGGGPGLAAGGGPIQLTVVVNGAKGDAEIKAMARQGAAEVLREYDRSVLPGSVKRISGDARRVG